MGGVRAEGKNCVQEGVGEKVWGVGGAEIERDDDPRSRCSGSPSARDGIPAQGRVVFFPCFLLLEGSYSECIGSG